MSSQTADYKQRGHLLRRSCHQKRSLKTSFDSEGEMAVTSTSGKKVKFNVTQNVKQNKVSKSSVLPKSNATSLKLPSVAVTRVEQSLQSIKHQPASSTTVKDSGLPMTIDDPDAEDASFSGNQRLLMREWLIHEVSRNRIPGLKWLDDDQTLMSIPWIHASKDGWSQDFHCKLFEKWAIYTGKYDPNKDKPEPKRWKANFRCALNSLPDVVEVPDMGRKNGMDGFKVYRFKDPVTRKNARKCKVSCKSLHAEYTKQSNPDEVFDQVAPSTSPVETDSNYAEKLKGFCGSSIVTAGPGYAVIACKTELIHDTVPSSDQYFTSISSVGDGGLVTVVVGDGPEVEATSVFCLTPHASSSEKDIIVLRNMDHNYFKLQIPTTVENYEDDDNSSLAGPQLEKSLRNPVR